MKKYLFYVFAFLLLIPNLSFAEDRVFCRNAIRQIEIIIGDIYVELSKLRRHCKRKRYIVKNCTKALDNYKILDDKFQKARNDTFKYCKPEPKKD